MAPMTAECELPDAFSACRVGEFTLGENVRAAAMLPVRGRELLA
jgi:hypothetical protein